MKTDPKEDPKDDSQERSSESLKKKIILSNAMTLPLIIGLLLLYGWKSVHGQTAITRTRHQGPGIIAKTTRNHDLQINDELRHSSKKLYELLIDIEGTYYDSECMILGTTLFSPHTYSRQPYVSNGYIGSRIPNVGFGYAEDVWNIWANADDKVPGALENGWPLRNRRFAGAFVSDFYCLQESLNSTNFPELDEDGYTTVIASIPQWTQLKLSVNGEKWLDPQTVNSQDVGNYTQELSMRNGVVTTRMDWLDGLLHIETEILAHKKIYPLGIVSIKVSLDVDHLPEDESSIKINFWDILDYNTSHRSVLTDKGYYDDGIYMVVEPENVPYSNTSIFSKCELDGSDVKFEEFGLYEEKVLQNASVILNRENSEINFHKYVGIISTEYSNESNTLDQAKDVVISNYGEYEKLVADHNNTWKEIYDNAFIEIPSDEVLEMTARSSLYHLLANTRKHNVSSQRGLPLPVSGLSSDSYGGMVFWDSDFWIQPGILPFFPDIAKNINNYRNATHEQAKLNAKQHGYPGALYPWTSGRYANCTSTGPCVDYEYHINVDICLASFSIYLNGAQGIDDDYLRYTTWPMVVNAAEFFTAFVKYNTTIGCYETHNLTDPDEFANHIDNGAFTNAGIKLLLKWATDIGNHLREPVDSRWMEISEKICIPRSDSNITLEYTGMNSSVEIKQADVALLVYPLAFITDESVLNNAIKDIYYYSEHQSASGPAMTYPVFVAAAAGLLNHGSSSQSYLYKSLLPYLRAPFAQFSEQSDDNFMTNGKTQPAFPFLTANGGFLQSILFGLTGIRYSYEVEPETKNIQRILKFDPIELPLLPGGIAIRNFKYLDQVLDIIIDDRNGTIAHKSGELPIKIKVPDRTLIRDRDITPYHGNGSAGMEKFIEDDDSHNGTSAHYYTINPGEELILPLFRMGLNVEGNFAEGKQVTNLTAGVPGDVAISTLDGNNYTHWQPADKSLPGKLLIDLGPNNSQIINKGMILWGQRPAKNFTISILPHSDDISHILSNLTTIVENTSIGDESVLEALEDIGGQSPLLSNSGDQDVKNLLSWKAQDVDDISLGISGESDVIRGKFLPILQDYKVKPSEQYFSEIYTKPLIEILPSNRTEFTIDYNNVHHNSTACSYKGLLDNCADWTRTRFIILKIEGSYDDDNDEKGGTIKEIVLMS